MDLLLLKTPPTTTVAPRSPFTTTLVTAANPNTEDVDDLVSGPVESDFLEEEGSDYSTKDSVESECGLVGDYDEDYDSDVHEEVRELRTEKRYFQRRKRKERVPVDTEEVPIGEAGVDLDVNEFRRAISKYVVQKRVQIEKCVNEPKRARCRCKEGCPWLLFACLDKTTNDFMIKTYNPKHNYNNTTRNYLCNAKFISTHFRKRINEQPNIRVFKLQELIRKKFKIPVGKTTVRRARAKVLKDITGDHIVEVSKILDYNDELLRTNPGSTCVVKLGEPDALGVCRGQLLVVLAKDGNNQMLPLAWAVVEYEKKETWTWFIKLLKEDLGLRDGEDLTLITDMQKDWRGLQRRQQFWSIAKSTFESQLRKNVAKMKLLGPEKMMDDLMYYNIEYWCKVYFNTQVKCDSVDNNMSECFNAGILAARHKTIITMLEEIRVLQENIDRSMNCNIEFNGDDGFEVREGPFQHSVDLGRWTCSCRVWQLKGIPCAHVVAAIYFKTCEPLDYIDNCYSKATYLRTYANVLQPITNMKMWHVSTNPTVAPPEIKGMSGKPGKLRKKEAGESKKSGKLPRTGLAMICSNCNVRGHNKRGCPQRVESSTREEQSNTNKGRGKTSGLGRPKKAQTEGPAKRSRERPHVAPSASASPTKGARGRPPIAPTTPNTSATPAKSARGRLPAAASEPPTWEAQPHTKGKQSLEWVCFKLENGFKALNLGMSSCKIFSTGTTKVTKSIDITGDIDYKLSTAPKLKWNGKTAISTRKLQEMREEQRKISRGSSSNNPILEVIILQYCFK
ncbi:hypothetical protein KY285_030846 [Solanum tuberosum]|nr:hypothetical protein KY285_030846 [Solanum tuberosum]